MGRIGDALIVRSLLIPIAPLFTPTYNDLTDKTVYIKLPFNGYTVMDQDKRQFRPSVVNESSQHDRIEVSFENSFNNFANVYINKKRKDWSECAVVSLNSVEFRERRGSEYV